MDDNNLHNDTGEKKEIRNPRRLLILSPSSHSLTLIPTLLNKLTGHPTVDPPAPTQTFAGYTTHPPLRIQNKYYTAEVPIWVDEIAIERPAKGTTEIKSDENEKEEAAAVNPTTGDAVTTSASSQWETEFSSSEAKVVRDAIGALMICVRNPDDSINRLPQPPAGEDAGRETSTVEDREDVRDLKDFIRAIGQVRALIEEERGEIGEVPGLLVLGTRGEDQQRHRRGLSSAAGDEGEDEMGLGDTGLGESEWDEPFSVSWWEGQLFEMGLIGFEVVRWNITGDSEEDDNKRNQYGELQGMRRIKEVLETHAWAAPDQDPDTGVPGDDDGDDDLDRELLGMDDEDGKGFDLEVNQLEREMVGLRLAIEKGGGDGEEDEDEEGDRELRVEAVESLLLRMKAIKDMSDDLPEKDRKRFAAKAVRDIMKEI